MTPSTSRARMGRSSIWAGRHGTTALRRYASEEGREEDRARGSVNRSLGVWVGQLSAAAPAGRGAKSGRRARPRRRPDTGWSKPGRHVATRRERPRPRGAAADGSLDRSPRQVAVDRAPNTGAPSGPGARGRACGPSIATWTTPFSRPSARAGSPPFPPPPRPCARGIG